MGSVLHSIGLTLIIALAPFALVIATGTIGTLVGLIRPHPPTRAATAVSAARARSVARRSEFSQLCQMYFAPAIGESQRSPAPSNTRTGVDRQARDKKTEVRSA